MFDVKLCPTLVWISLIIAYQRLVLILKTLYKYYQKCAQKRQKSHNELNMRNSWDEEYAYIVVGAGSAGCVVAARLSENANIKVLLIEAGGPQTQESDMSGRQQYLYKSESSLIRSYPQISQKNSNFGYINNESVLKKGIGIGGSSITNRMNWYRGNVKIYDIWENTYGANGWSYKDVLPYFLKSENNLDLELVAKSNGTHTTGGPVSVSTVKPDIMLQRFVTAAKILGYPVTDSDGVNQYGVTIMQTNTKNGIRQSISMSYLEPNVYRNNLLILGNTICTKILFNDKKAIGVQFYRNRKYYTVNAIKEVILSAGAFESPKLLMLSGIGPKEHLKKFNIPVLSDLRVGDNYHGGYGIPLYLDIKNQSDIPKPELNLENKINYYLENSGPLAYVGSGIMCFNSSLDWMPGIPSGCIFPRVLFMSDNLDNLVSNYKLKEEWKSYYRPYLGRAYIDLMPNLQLTKSYGTLRLASKNPLDFPILNPRMFSDRIDLDILVETMKSALKITQTDYFKQFAEIYNKSIPGCNYCNGNNKLCDDYLRCVSQTITLPVIPVGTCKMGSVNDPTTVVDSKLRVKGVNGLRVIDASVVSLFVPQTNAATVMIGERGAKFILDDNC